MIINLFVLKSFVRGCRNVVSLWAPVVGWCSLIFWLSSRPDSGGAPSELPELMFRKLAHVVEYAVLAFLTARALANGGRPPRRVLWGAFVFCALFAVSDEIHQTFVPGRYGKVRDVALDVGGASLVLFSFGRQLSEVKNDR